VLADPLDRLAQLRPAVASLAAEHITGEAFTVQAHQRQSGRGGPAEFHGDVLLAVGQAGKTDDRCADGVAVSQTQRDAYTPADRRPRSSHGTSRTASRQLDGAISGVPEPVTRYGRSVTNDLQFPGRRIG
jgi:hypothetical protein